jgi:glycosyltransferase involved in cell wall biosynthesis
VTVSTAGPLSVSQTVTFVLPTTGEYDSRTRRMATSLASRGHRIRVIARRTATAPDEETWPNGVVVTRVGERADTPLSNSAPAGLSRLFREPLRVARVARRASMQARAAADVDAGTRVYHAMGFLGLPVALALRARRSPEEGSRVVYDARDLYAESNNVARLPEPLRAVFRWRERSWARRADAVVTVNQSIATIIARRWSVEPVVVMNAQPRWSPPAHRPDLWREQLRLTRDVPVILYHGGFMADRGLPELIRAHRDPRLRETQLVLMGSGAMEHVVSTMAEAPDSRGRVHVVSPVPPAMLLEYVASADVCVMPNQPRTLNERLSTPNKLFEALAAGVPVVSSDFPERRRIIVDDPLGPLGEVCDPTDPTAIATAIAAVVWRSPEERDELRARCLRAAHERYAWEQQFDNLLGLYGRLTGHPW